MEALAGTCVRMQAEPPLDAGSKLAPFLLIEGSNSKLVEEEAIISL